LIYKKDFKPSKYSQFWERHIKSSSIFWYYFWWLIIIMETINFFGTIFNHNPITINWYISGALLVYCVEFISKWHQYWPRENNE